jgi:RHS repeat-associated protein
VLTDTLPGGRSIDYGYDGAGRTNAITLGSGPVYTFGYDAQGRAQTATRSGTPAVTNSFNQGLTIGQTWSGAGQVNGSVNLDYDNDLRISSVSVNGADPVAISYDNDSRPTAIGALTIGRPAPPQAPLVTSVTLSDGAANSVQDSYGYNTLGELTTATTGFNGSSGTYSLALTRDGLGRVTSKSQSVNGVPEPTETYTYDSAGRLATANVGGIVTTYSYDLQGNRTGLQVGANPPLVGVHDSQDRLMSWGISGTPTSYSYLLDGHVLSKTPFGGSPTTFTYDELGNLLQVAQPGSQVDYVVDGQGRRVERRKNGLVTQRWLYQHPLQIAAELDASNAVVIRFVYAGGNSPEYMIKNNIRYRLVKDHLGSVRLVVNTTDGSIAQRLNYDPWGVVTVDTNPGFQPFGFAGGIYDPDTSLVRFGARDYDPEIGRWTAKDPIGFNGQDANLYAYVANLPTAAVDHVGMAPTCPPPGGHGASNANDCPDAVGSIAEIKGGVVQIKRAGSKHWEPARAGMQVGRGDSIRSGSGGSAAIEFALGGRALLQERSGFTIAGERSIRRANAFGPRNGLGQRDAAVGAGALGLLLLMEAAIQYGAPVAASPAAPYVLAGGVILIGVGAVLQATAPPGTCVPQGQPLEVQTSGGVMGIKG